MRKINICHILEATIGGTRTHLNLLTAHLNKDIFNLSVICSTLREPSFQNDILKMKKRGITVHCVKMHRQINVFKDLLSIFSIYRILQKYKFDIIHTHSSKAGFIGRVSAKIIGIKNVVYSPHSYAFQSYSNGFKRNFFIWIERLMAPITSIIVCVSDSEMTISIDNHIAEERKLALISNAVDINREPWVPLSVNNLRNSLQIKSNRKVIGTVGYYRPQKGFPLLLTTASEVVKKLKNVVFLVIGTGNPFELTEAIRRHGLEDYFLLLPHVNNINKYYPIFDVLLLTSLYEGMSYSVLEAMSIGIPIIATDVSGNRDIVISGYNGLLVPLDDPNRISEAVIELLKDPIKRKQLGRNGRRLIEEKYQMKEKIREFEKLYKRLCL